jgi:hypothetical protein
MLHQTEHIHPVGIYALQRNSNGVLERKPTALRDAFRTYAVEGDLAVGRLEKRPAVETPSQFLQPKPLPSRPAKITATFVVPTGSVAERATQIAKHLYRFKIAWAAQTTRQETLSAPSKVLFLSGAPADWLELPPEREAKIVYDASDLYSVATAADLSPSQQGLLAEADLVIFPSITTRRAFHSLVGKKCKVIPDGVDLRNFSRACRKHADSPPDIRFITHPLLGYFGEVDEFLDYELIAEIGRANPSWQVALIGPVRPGVTLPRTHNLFWLGARDFSTLGLYARAFDLCILPYRTEVNRVREWSAQARAMLLTGRKLVTTVAPADRGLRPYLRVNLDRSAFISACQQLAFGGRRSSRHSARHQAAKRSWRRVAREVEAALREIGIE